jgi:hypothetical protein
MWHNQMLDQENEEKLYKVHHYISIAEDITILYIDTSLHNAYLVLDND